jgi:16S rRNA G966 N2-methylase RsmD
MRAARKLNTSAHSPSGPDAKAPKAVKKLGVYDAKRRGNSNVLVAFPVSSETENRIREQAEALGTTAAALMTEILTQAANRPVVVDYVSAGKSARTAERNRLFQHFADKLVVNPMLTRKLVSFQTSKTAPFYRWLKFKEAFSPELVDYLFDLQRSKSEQAFHVLDPFAGTGTTLTRACARQWNATGIELLPVGVHALKARLLADKVNLGAFRKALAGCEKLNWAKGKADYRFQHLRITEAAFPTRTEFQLARYLNFVNSIADEDTRFLFWFAALSVLEEVSYTRKDGQYLRWDYRSGRKLGKRFDKGVIHEFSTAVQKRLVEFHQDLQQRNGGTFSKHAHIVEGSCLQQLPKLTGDQFDVVLTSPPYCNRYDYTRTYALELAFCGCDEEAIRRLRQTLLSATVENKSKREHLRGFYESIGASARHCAIQSAFNDQRALHEVLALLRQAGDRGELSNSNVPCLVENYFYEMAHVIFELARILKPGGRAFIVNDNVRYHGEEVPVDLILSDLAEKAGLLVDRIWVLPRGKGNSSQQMGKWGRVELRKCVYCWRKP